ncbi:hypothetical protein PINS_up010807 [Pythium insidiosum]|nr:hypothetical protein PINS_up010807 [Pythium insidiosum]
MTTHAGVAASPQSVLLLKGDDDKYREAFTSVSTAASLSPSYDVHFADVLTFEYVNAEQLRAKLLRLHDFSAILVTSPRAGIAIQRVVASLDPSSQTAVLSALRDHVTVISVGQATSRELESLGVSCIGDHCGSAEVLSAWLHDNGQLPESCRTKPTLFLCGDKRRDTMPESFLSRGLALEELRVYQTCAVPDFRLPETCPQPDWVAFFSPSGIKAIRGLALPWQRVKKAAIGKTTASALQHVAQETGDATWSPDVVAPSPTAKSLAESIIAFDAAHL